MNWFNRIQNYLEHGGLRFAIATILFGGLSGANTPNLVSYQGCLTDGIGTPLSGVYSLLFEIYTAPIGGIIAWGETQNVTVTSGTFSVLLGSVNQFSDALFSDSVRYLQITVGANPPISPRTRLVTSPNAFRTSTLDGASGGNISGSLSLGSANSYSGLSVAVFGDNNGVSANYAFVGGGNINTVTGLRSGIIGGRKNSVSGDQSAVVSGDSNSVEGDRSVILGGTGNRIAGFADHSFVFGNQVLTTSAYRFYVFDGSLSGHFAVNRDANDGGTSHPIHVGTTVFNGNGARLTAGGVWTDASSRTFKENFVEIGGSELLDKISQLSLPHYNYKGTTEKHIGPMAEDFAALFDVGSVDENTGQIDPMYLSAKDVAGVSLAGVRELIAKNNKLENRVTELERLVQSLLNSKK